MESSVSSLGSPSVPAYVAGPFLDPHDARPSSQAGKAKQSHTNGVFVADTKFTTTTTTTTPPNAIDTHAMLPPHLRLADGTPDYLRLILSADIYDLVKATPLTKAVNLSSRLGCDVLMKREDLQPVFSFKIRGAYNMMRSLPEEQKWKGVIACSAGNHAQGVAMAGAHLSIPCTIVMPLATPTIKTANVRRLGAKVVLHGNDFDAAKAECSRLAQSHGLAIIPPFDHPRVIAGQGTVAVEMCRQTDMDKLDAIFCCVGGGGLLAGVAAYVKRIAPPHVKVIGVETYDADALTRSLERGERVTLDEVGLFSDGTAVRVVGEECFRLCRGLVDGMVRVDTDEICAAIRDIFEDTRSVPEPAGALAVAGMKRYVAHHNLFGSGKRFGVLVSGANMNFSRLRFVAERAELGDQREVLLMVEVPEKPGSFLRLYQHIYPRAITEFSYRLNDAKKARIFLSFLLDATGSGQPVAVPNGVAAAAMSPSTSASLETAAAAVGARAHPQANGGHVGGSLAEGHAPAGQAAGERTTSTTTGHAASTADAPVAQLAARRAARSAELRAILARINADGGGDMVARDISSNEVAKSHARYMVGGAAKVKDERLFQFTFPERPGSLHRFLTGLNAGWNVSLFNYRNAGGDQARILAGVQVSQGERAAFEAFLHELGYAWSDETDNVVYRSFLAG